uniref:Uncharacterized protein n=1 Tax=Cyanoderma ruficeps TaxID=181631 RepID=A0A8C3NQT3_9PASS
GAKSPRHNRTRPSNFSSQLSPLQQVRPHWGWGSGHCHPRGMPACHPRERQDRPGTWDAQRRAGGHGAAPGSVLGCKGIAAAGIPQLPEGGPGGVGAHLSLLPSPRRRPALLPPAAALPGRGWSPADRCRRS